MFVHLAHNLPILTRDAIVLFQDLRWFNTKCTPLKHKLTFAGFTIRFQCVAFMTAAHKRVLCVHTLMFTAVIAQSTLVNF